MSQRSNKKGNATVVKLSKEMTKREQLRKRLEEQFLDIDPETLADTLEGETDVTECCLLIAEEIAEREAMTDAVQDRIATLQERKGRIVKGTNTLREVITQAMDRSEIKTIPGELCTLSVRDVAPGLKISDEPSIPARFWEPQPPKLNKNLLTAALSEGEAVDGASLDNGGISLTIRRK